jgi:division protein CdvB (Snf7/Vps24/ESCRT-III family)
MTPPLGVFSSDDVDKGLKDKIGAAIRQVDVQRKELEQLRHRLDERRKLMFDSTVRAIEKHDEMRARVLAGEHVELQKIGKVVNASELALLHISVRLETIRDVGDIMYVLTTAFKAVRKIGKSVAEVAPNLEQAASEINESFSGILAELGMVSPNVTLSLTDTPSEIFHKAQNLINERTSELSDLPKSLERTEARGESIFEMTKKVAILATEGDDDELDSEEFKPVLYSGFDEAASDPEHAIRDYLKHSDTSKIDVNDASAQLNLPVDLVEQAYIKVLAEKRFTANSSNSMKQTRTKSTGT